MISDYLLLSKIYYIFFINVYLIRSVSLWYCYSWATITIISIIWNYINHTIKNMFKSFFLFNVCFMWVLVQLISKSVSLSFSYIFFALWYSAHDAVIYWYCCRGSAIILSSHFQILRVSISLKTLFCFLLLYILLLEYIWIYFRESINTVFNIVCR